MDSSKGQDGETILLMSPSETIDSSTCLTFYMYQNRSDVDVLSVLKIFISSPGKETIYGSVYLNQVCS